MTVNDYIKRKFSHIGDMTDMGASDFALDFGFNASEEVTESGMRAISSTINDFIEKNILHPTSIGESGFSTLWSADSIKNYTMVVLKKYGISLNSETAALLGVNVITDKSNLW